MKKLLLSIMLIMILFTTLSPTAAAQTVENQSVSVGDSAVVITANKDLYFWGAFGTYEPKKILSNVEYASINGSTSSDGIAVAITTNGDLYVWGFNAYGQVGVCPAEGWGVQREIQTRRSKSQSSVTWAAG